MQRAKVSLFTLGGTIAMANSADGGAVPTFTGADLTSAVPGLAETGIDVDVHDVRQVPGAAVDIGDVCGLVPVMAERLADGASGAVVTQGTDTIEESAFLLDLLHSGDAPVVVTGAMRNPSLAGADGPANLLAAVTAAASPEVRGMGALVAFGDQLHAARQVRKAHSTSPGAFVSPNSGPVGHVVEGRVRLVSRPAGERVTFALPDGDRRPWVPIVTAAIGETGDRLMSALRAGPADGVVVAAFGAGHVPPGMADVMGRVVTELNLPVVLSSRTGAGSVLATTYGFVGSESDLLARGLISAGHLDPAKARVLLYLLICHGASRDDIARRFAQMS